MCKKYHVFHIIRDCKFVKVIWRRIEITLYKIIPEPVTMYEKAFGLQVSNKNLKGKATLRNFLTFSLWHEIMLEETIPNRKNNHFFENLIII